MGLWARLTGTKKSEATAEAAPPRVVVETIGVPRAATARRRADLHVDQLNIMDLRHLEARRLRVVGSSYVCSDRDRQIYGGTQYLLVREPDNRADVNAVAVYGKGRQLGYASSSKAGSLGPLLDRLGADAYLVDGASVTEASIKLWVDLPTLPALRAHVAASG
ncbi:HIRAN domain-containing protein [Clavibacter californiensis]|nr:HIRAN domain-containing protein [Clavibacter californiensis]